MAKAYGDQIDKSGSVAAALHRGWMSLKDAVTKSDTKAILEVAKQGEDHAVTEYEKALGEDISDGLRIVLQRQFERRQGGARYGCSTGALRSVTQQFEALGTGRGRRTIAVGVQRRPASAARTFGAGRAEVHPGVGLLGRESLAFADENLRRRL